MNEWRPIETAPTGKGSPRIAVARFVKGRINQYGTAFWFEGDLTAGWADAVGKPLGFEPTHWALPESST